MIFLARGRSLVVLDDVLLVCSVIVGGITGVAAMTFDGAWFLD